MFFDEWMFIMDIIILLRYKMVFFKDLRPAHFLSVFSVDEYRYYQL